jgi:hypothetical protein
MKAWVTAIGLLATVLGGTLAAAAESIPKPLRIGALDELDADDRLAVPLVAGILIFRADGTLADYHAPLPSDVFSHVQAAAVIEQARRLGLHLRGAPLSIVRSPDGQLTIEARVMRNDGSTEWMDAFTLDKPQGERRDITSRGYGGPEKDALLKRAGIVLSVDELTK